uniref:TatD family hydrolase n=1 Tax=Eubacterium cellulosolvens TaxID=29322 RepID=UPI00048835C3|nr:TatD family hydrolase [[Eubacterium] cellulosolvens]
MIFDTHTHYDDEAFDGDREKVLDSIREAGVRRFVNVSAEWSSLGKIRRLTEGRADAYAAYGIHPDNVGELSDDRFEELKNYCLREECVAVGEIGLDYHWNVESRETQIYWFKRQLALAREMKLPIIIHSRDAAADTMEIAREEEIGRIGGVVHCYSYSAEQAVEYVDMGMYIGIGGVLTFKNARKLRQVVETIPLDKLVLETDCPYLAPEPNRGRRNNSAYLKYVAAAIAEIKGITEEEVEAVTWENACRMYGLPVDLSV